MPYEELACGFFPYIAHKSQIIEIQDAKKLKETLLENVSIIITLYICKNKYALSSQNPVCILLNVPK